MVVGTRHCQAIAEGGEPCRAAPRQARPFCFWHDPETEGEAREARRLGGFRRRKDATVAGTYDLADLASVDGIRRVVEIAITDTLELSNSVARNQTLGRLAQIAQRILEGGEFADRLEALEAAVLPRIAARRR